MKGIETRLLFPGDGAQRPGSDHCPAMKGIETEALGHSPAPRRGSDHCPAMKGIETRASTPGAPRTNREATTAPQ